MKSKYLIGIDEAGRGPLAGPVAVGVFLIQKDQKSKFKILKKVKDSKILTHEQREEFFKEIEILHKAKACYAVGMSSALYIDSYGIVPAIKSAMKKALTKVMKELNIKPEDCEVLLDGSLKAPDEFLNQKTIIKGDAKIPVISAASICAKVLRDRHMVKISKKYSHYDFHIHKGYGTKKHRDAIVTHGICKEHRMCFLKNIL